MMQSFDEAAKIGKDMMENGLKSFAALSKGAQAIAAEATEFSRKSFEEGSAAAEKLLAARTIESAFEVQTDYARSAYERFVAESARFSELFADLAKQAYQPYEPVRAAL